MIILLKAGHRYRLAPGPHIERRARRLPGPVWRLQAIDHVSAPLTALQAELIRIFSVPDLVRVVDAAWILATQHEDRHDT